MASVNNPASQINTTRVGMHNCFRRLLRSGNCFSNHIVLGRYYVAIMLFIANSFYIWRLIDIDISFHFAQFDAHFFAPAIENWTKETHETFTYRTYAAQMCVQVPAALLIHLTSSHKFLTAAVAISSVFHMLLPMAVILHPSILIIMLYAQSIVQAPLRIAMLSIWKDWAPPGEQTKFVLISFSSLILGSYFYASINHFLEYVFATHRSFYLSGACGLVWSLLWFYTISDTPNNNRQCSQNEQPCLQNNTLSACKYRQKLTDVPWKRILISKPVFALCLIYFKMGGSYIILYTISSKFNVTLFLDGYISTLTFLNTIFWVLYTVILFSSAITTDFFNRKYPRWNRKIKKDIYCAVLIVHGIILIGTLDQRIILQTTVLCISYIVFYISVPGLITNALELSTKYVAIIGGIIETFYRLGILVSQYYMTEMSKNMRQKMVYNRYGKLPLYEVAVAIFVAVIFFIWGSVEEQPWSLNTASHSTSPNTEAHNITPEEHELSAVPSNTSV